MEISPEALYVSSALLGTVTVCGLFVCSEVVPELPARARSLFGAIRATRGRPGLPPRTETAVTMVLPPPERAPGTAALTGLLLSAALHANTNLTLGPLRDAWLPLEIGSLAGGSLFVVAVALLPLSEWLGELGPPVAPGLVRIVWRRGGPPGAVGGLALLLALVVSTAAHAAFDLRTISRRGSSSLFAEPPPPALPRPRFSVERLHGSYVGTLGMDTLVLNVARKRGTITRVDCALNVMTREEVMFEAAVTPRRGLAGRLPGLDVRFGPAREGRDGRLRIPLLDDEDTVRGELSETDVRDRRMR